MLGGLQGGLQGGPAILSPAEQLSGQGWEGASVFDADPYMDKTCARHNTGTYCKATTTPGVELYEAVQTAINEASAALTSVASELEGGLDPLKVDGVIGPATANRATQILTAVGPHGKAQAWLEDPRSQQAESMAPLLAAQPQLAKETFDEIAETLKKMGPVPSAGPAAKAASEVTSQIIPPIVQSAPTAPQTFWTRRNKIIVGVAVGGTLTLGALLWWLLSRRH